MKANTASSAISLLIQQSGGLLPQAPKKRYALGIFPTPVHRWHPPGLPDDVEMYIKRDDLSGMQLSGNKVSLPHDIAQAIQYCHSLHDSSINLKQLAGAQTGVSACRGRRKRA